MYFFIILFYEPLNTYFKINSFLVVESVLGENEFTCLNQINQFLKHYNHHKATHDLLHYNQKKLHL